MANLINGNGYAAVYADQDADWYASIMGNQTSITGVGQQFEASILDAQTIGVADGVIITQEGRRIQLDADQVDTFEIPVGEQGTTNYYIIGYHLYTTDDSSQVCDTFVQLMESSSATIQEDTFRGGADEVYVSLYRVTQDGLTITDIDSLLPTIKDLTEIAADISQINNDLTANDLGTVVDIGSYTIQNPYVIPSDGYVTVTSHYSVAGTTAIGVILGSTNNTTAVSISATSTARDSDNTSIFVRKGMRAYLAVTGTGLGLTFRPIE